MANLSTYAALLGAILLEVAGTSALQASHQFTRLAPSLTMLACYVGAFFLLSLTLREIPVGISYAIWSGLGIVLISTVGWIAFDQKLDAPAIIGMAFIILGVVIINLFSATATH